MRLPLHHPLNTIAPDVSGRRRTERNQVDSGNVAQWAGAVASTAAVIVALFKEEILRRFRRPRLTTSIKARHPYCVRTAYRESANSWTGWRYFLRIMIENKGNMRAEKVEVFLSRALVQQSDGAFVLVPEFTPMNLRWSHTEYDDPEIYVDGISPGKGRLCDLAAISDPSSPRLKSILRDSEMQTRLSLRLEVLPRASDWLPPGRYKFEILVAGSNFETVTHSIELHLTGVWSEDVTHMLNHGVIFGRP